MFTDYFTRTWGAGSGGVRRAIGLLWCVFWLGLPLSAPALAQPVEMPLEARNAQAKKLYKEGVAEVSRRQWGKARALFLQAFGLKQHFQIALSLGQSELTIGLYREAAEHLTYFLREGQDVASDVRQKGEQMLAEARAHVGTLLLRADREGAELLVDGSLVGKAPLDHEVFVEPGSRVIEARLAGYEGTRETREIAAGAQVRTNLRLIKRVEPPRAKAIVPLAITGVAAAAAVMGIGIALAAMSQAKASESEMYQGVARAPFEALQQAKADLANAAVVSFTLAGAVFAGTVISALLSPSEPTARPKVTALVGRREVGAMFTLRW